MSARGSSWKMRAALGGMTAAVVLGGFLSFRLFKNEEAEQPYKETLVKRGNLTAGVTESGSVAIGTVTQDLEGLEAAGIAGTSESGQGKEATGAGESNGQLKVEEVYLSAGAFVKAGDAILKLSEESVEACRETLQDTCRAAELAESKARLEAKAKTLNAKYTHDSSVLSGSVAQSEYDAALAELQASVDLARTKLEASAVKIAEYQEKIQKGEGGQASLAEEQANYNSLAAKLQSEQNVQAVKSAEARQSYEAAIQNSGSAGSLYQAETADADLAAEDAQEALQDARDALSSFNALIGDGTIYAMQDGTVYSVGYEAGDMLSSSAVAEFADPENVTITVSVSQEDIASVHVGDEAEIVLTAYADKAYCGAVKSVDTSSSSGSAAVSYDVTVLFSGDVSDVYPDMTGNVTFVSERAEDVCYVMKKAVVTIDGDAYLNVRQEDGEIGRVKVTTGISDGVYIEIKEGIEEGSEVIVESRRKTE